MSKFIINNNNNFQKCETRDAAIEAAKRASASRMGQSVDVYERIGSAANPVDAIKFTEE